MKSVVGSLFLREQNGLSLSPFILRLPWRALRGGSQFRDTRRSGSIESELLRALLAWRFLEDSEGEGWNALAAGKPPAAEPNPDFRFETRRAD